MKKKIIFVVALAAVIVIIYNITPLERNINNHIVSKGMREINKDSLAKYYDAFRMKFFFERNGKKEFLDYIEKYNLNLHEQLSDEHIRLYPIQRNVNLNSNEGLYYVMSNDNNNYILYNYYQKKYKTDFIYAIDDNNIIPISYLNTSKMIAKSIPCKEGEVKYTIDTLSLDSSKYFMFSKIKDSSVKFSKEKDERLLKIFESDSLISEISRKYDFIFSRFSHEPIDNFYCDKK